MLEIQKADNNIRKALFVSLRAWYLTVVRYVEECPGSGRVILTSVVNR